MKVIRNVFYLATFTFLLHSQACHSVKKWNPILDQVTIIDSCLYYVLQNDSGLNTASGLIDFSGCNYFVRPAIDTFLKKMPAFKESNADSMIKNDTSWTKHGFFQNVLFNFRECKQSGDTLIFYVDKLKAKDGSEGFEIIIYKNEETIRVIKTRMTWIS